MPRAASVPQMPAQTRAAGPKTMEFLALAAFGRKQAATEIALCDGSCYWPSEGPVN
jgi:hypothetical protein